MLDRTFEGEPSLDELEIVAHHEAAHAVAALHYGLTLSGGIDLHAPTSVEGASGNVMVNLFDPDPKATEDDQIKLLVTNLATICAGAASDAKLRKRLASEALERQPGDLALAKRTCELHPIVEDKSEAQIAINGGLKFACSLIECDHIWQAIEEVATACLDNGGLLGKEDLERIATTALSKDQ